MARRQSGTRHCRVHQAQQFFQRRQPPAFALRDNSCRGVNKRRIKSLLVRRRRSFPDQSSLMVENRVIGLRCCSRVPHREPSVRRMVDPRSISYIPNWFSVHDSPRSATRTVDSHAYGFAAAADRLILAHSIQKTTPKRQQELPPGSKPRTIKSDPPTVAAAFNRAIHFCICRSIWLCFCRCSCCYAVILSAAKDLLLHLPLPLRGHQRPGESPSPQFISSVCFHLSECIGILSNRCETQNSESRARRCWRRWTTQNEFNGRKNRSVARQNRSRRTSTREGPTTCNRLRHCGDAGGAARSFVSHLRWVVPQLPGRRI